MYFVMMETVCILDSLLVVGNLVSKLVGHKQKAVQEN